MKTNVLKYFKSVLLLVGSVLLFSSCEVTYPTPPPGGGSSGGYYPVDADLVGSWELAYINGHRVSGYEVNYLDFYDNGRGYYYYYDYGMEYELGFDFWSEYSGASSYLFIDYYDGTRAQMTYQFSPDYYTLYLEWWEGGRKIVYTYFYISDIYWAPQTTKSPKGYGLRPGTEVSNRLSSSQIMPDSIAR